jgi:hypothetical protein
LDILSYLSTSDSIQQRTGQDPVLKCFGSSQESSSLWIFQENQDIKSIIEVAGKGIHNFLVASKNTEIDDLSILSQTDILHFLFSKRNEMKSNALLGRSLNDLPVMQKKLVTANVSDTVADTLQLMKVYITFNF